MGVDAYIRDSEGDGYGVGVSSTKALKTGQTHVPAAEIPNAELTAFKTLREFAEDGGSNALNIDGSVTPVEFTVMASTSETRWITGLRFLFNDENMDITANDFRRFGSATASNTPLTNGIRLISHQGTVETEIFKDPVATIGDFLNYSDAYLNLVSAVSASVDFLSFDFDLDTPVVLPSGSLDHIAVVIQDDLTAVNLFQVIARGYREEV